MIHGVRLINFGNHEDSRLEFGRITALVGRNGAGKTTVLRAIRELARIAAGPTTADLDPQELLPKSQPANSVGLAYENFRSGSVESCLCTSGPGRLHEKAGTWGLAISGSVEAGKANGVVPVKLQWSWLPGENHEKVYLPDAGNQRASEEAARKTFAEMRQALASEGDSTSPRSTLEAAVPVSFPNKDWLPEVLDCQYLHGVGVNIHKASYSSEIPPRLTSEGDNLPSVIAYLMTYEPERFEVLLDSFRKLVPIVSRIRVRPAKVQKRVPTVVTVNRKELVSEEFKDYTGHELIFDLKSGKGVPAHFVSEGTLLILALLTIFHTTEAPRLVLIDDLEQALHPWAQRELVQHFKSLQVERSNLQLILTTHSPYIVDELQAEEVWMLAENKQGIAVAKRLSAHPDLDRAKGVLTTGEFWSAEGEAWITGE